jgi:hypothetical protein
MHWFKRFLFAVLLSLLFGLFSFGVITPPFTTAKLVVLSLGSVLSVPFCWYMRRQLVKRYAPASRVTKQRSIQLMVMGMAVLTVLTRLSPSAKDWINLGVLVFSLAAFVAFVYSAFYLVWHRPPPA